MQAAQAARRIEQGDRRQAALLMRGLERGEPWAREALALLSRRPLRSWIIGLTGPPGVGKSTLADRLLAHLRGRGLSVGVVAVDPSSPVSGGAILGDRLRMQRHASDSGVFIRSLASRGRQGGLAAAVRPVVRVMDALGLEVVLVETVGVGQDQVEVARLAECTVLVTAPGLGDWLQAIKAGILELAQVLVVNQADRPGAEPAAEHLRAMLALRRTPPEEWTPPVLLTSARDGDGLEELWQALERHRLFMRGQGGGRLERQRRAAARAELVELVRQEVLEELQRRLVSLPRLEELAGELAGGRTDPQAAARELLEMLGMPTTSKN